MRRTFTYFAALAACLSLLLVSCEKDGLETPKEDTGQTQEPDDSGGDDQEEPEPEPEPEPQSNTFDISASVSGFLLSDLDALDMRLIAAGEPAPSVYALDGFTASDKASFSVTVPSETTEGYLYYPYSADPTAYQAEFAFASYYVQAEAGKNSNLMLVSDRIDFPADASVATLETTVRPAGHILAVAVYDSADKGEQLKSVTITADGSAVISSEKYICHFSPEYSTELSGASSSAVKVELGTPYSLAGVISSEVSSLIYIPVVPAEGVGYTCTVETDNETYEFQYGESFSWIEGGSSRISLDLASVREPVVPKYLTFEFTNKGILSTERVFTNAGGVQNTDYYIVMVDGTEDLDYSAPYYWDFEYEITDGAGIPADWVSIAVVADNKFDITCTENTSIESRHAVINVYFRDTEEYIVQGTYKSVPAQLEPVTGDDPILTFTISQDGVPQAGDKPVLKYFFVGKGVNYNWSTTLPDAQAGNISGQEWGWYGCQLDGADVPDSDSTVGCYRDLTFKAYGQDGSEVSWLTGKVYDFGQNRFDISYEANPSPEPRTAVMKVFYTGDGDYEIQSYTFTAEGKSESITIGNPAEEPVYMLTVTQPGSAQ